MRAPVAAGLFAASLAIVAIGCGEPAPGDALGKFVPRGELGQLVPDGGLGQLEVTAEYPSPENPFRGRFEEGGVVEVRLDAEDTTYAALLDIGVRTPKVRLHEPLVFDLAEGTYVVTVAARACAPQGCTAASAADPRQAGAPEGACHGRVEIEADRVAAILILVEPQTPCEIRSR